MNNLFGIGILLELKDHVSQRLRRVSSSMEDVQSEAERTTRTFNDMGDSINNSSSSFDNVAGASSHLGGAFNHTSSYARKMERQMQRLSAILGGEVPESTREAYQEMFRLRQEMKSTQRAYGSWSMEAMFAAQTPPCW